MPCPCGHLGDPRHPCRCAPSRIDAYRQRLSGPLLDRIDIFVELAAVPAEALATAPASEPSSIVRERVLAARARQRARNGIDGTDGRSNAALGLEDIERSGHLDEEARGYLARAGERLGLSARAWHRVVRVARTVADLAGDADVRRQHVAEALTFRRFRLRPAADQWTSPRA